MKRESGNLEEETRGRGNERNDRDRIIWVLCQQLTKLLIDDYKVRTTSQPVEK